MNYHFVTREAFQERIDRGEFLEYAEYVGNFYGTSMAVIREKLDQGVDVTLEIESQGAAKVRQKMPEDCKWGIRTVYGVGYKFGMTE